MAELQTSNETIPNIQKGRTRRHRISQRRCEQILLWLSILIIYLSVYAILITYQHNRYDVDKFNCVDFTGETIDVFKKFNIVSFQVVGENKKTGELHSWVGIPFGGTILHFEPQNLMLFDAPAEYKDIYVNYKSCQ